ncbi:MAG TPA: HDOD domain-containing protein [Myxococcales bacterium]|nr:HDOD domain-containing protein [Myxococcales bacterium]
MKPQASSHPSPDFAELARICKLERTAEPPPGPRQAEEDAALADQVLAHYEANRPGPESMPSLSLQILNLVAAPTVDAQKLATLVAQDPALAANVVRVANSVLHKGVSEIETVRDAVARLGLDEVGRLAGAVSARSLFNPRLRAQFASFDTHFRRLFEDALIAAIAASWLAMRKPAVNSGRAYLGGLLHDIGKTIALRSVAALAAERTISPRPGSVPRVIEQLHCTIGEDAARGWGLPAFLVRMIAHHHDGLVETAEIIDLGAIRLVSALRALKLRDPHQPNADRELVESTQLLEVTAFELRALDAELPVFAARAQSLA